METTAVESNTSTEELTGNSEASDTNRDKPSNEIESGDFAKIQTSFERKLTGDKPLIQVRPVSETHTAGISEESSQKNSKDL